MYCSAWKHNFPAIELSATAENAVSEGWGGRQRSIRGELDGCCGTEKSTQTTSPPCENRALLKKWINKKDYQNLW